LRERVRFVQQRLRRWIAAARAHRAEDRHRREAIDGRDGVLGQHGLRISRRVIPSAALQMHSRTPSDEVDLP
jgi:hypothetical protein